MKPVAWESMRRKCSEREVVLPALVERCQSRAEGVVMKARLEVSLTFAFVPRAILTMASYLS